MNLTWYGHVKKANNFSPDILQYITLGKDKVAFRNTLTPKIRTVERPHTYCQEDEVEML